MPIDRDATLRTAEKLLRQGRLDAAIAEYVRLAGAYPSDWSSINTLGDLYARAGQMDRAVAQFARVADRLLRDGAVAKASAVYRKILRLNPSDPRGARGLAAAAALQADATAGAQAFSDDPDARMAAARQALDAGDVAGGCALLVEAADLYMAGSRHADAVAAIAEAADADPSNPETRQRTIRMLIDQGELKQARYFARAVPELLIVAEALERAGRPSEAADLAVEAAAFDPDNLGLRHRVLTDLVNDGEIERARGLARTASELLVVADALGRENRSAEVLDVIGEAVQQVPGNAQLRERFIDACLATGAIDRARHAARSGRDWLLVSRALADAGRHAERIEAMRDATDREPQNAALHADFVRACLEGGDLDRAREAARTTEEMLAVADAREQRGDTTGALEARAEALRRDPDDPKLRSRLVEELIRAGDTDRARWLARSPDELLEIARLLDEGGHQAEAIDARIDALERLPSNRALRADIVATCVGRGDFGRARRALTLESAGDDPDLLLLLARLELLGDRPGEAGRVLGRLLEVDRSRRHEVIALAGEMTACGKPGAAALCLELFTDSAALADEWAEAAAGLRQFAERVPNHLPALTKLVEICVDGGLYEVMPEAQALLADAYLTERRSAEARVVCEDLFLRRPWEPRNVERLARALSLTGDGDPLRTMADLLASENPVSLEEL